MNTLFIQAPAITLRFLLLLLFSAAILIADHRYRALETPRGWLLTMMQPVQAIADWPAQRWHRWSAAVAARTHLLEENQRLRETNHQLAIEHQRFSTLQAENRRLNELLQSVSVSNPAMSYQLARVVQVSLDPHIQQVQINSGSAQGVFLGQPVISSAGVFGQVVHVAVNSAQVLLLTDISHALPVVNQRSGQRAIARGEGPSGLLRMPFLAAHADVQPGDLWLTSGLGKTFPAGYPVARLKAVVIPPGAEFAEVVAVPVAQPEKVQEVLLLWPAANHAPEEHPDENPVEAAAIDE